MLVYWCWYGLFCMYYSDYFDVVFVVLVVVV